MSHWKALLLFGTPFIWGYVVAQLPTTWAGIAVLGVGSIVTGFLGGEILYRILRESRRQR